MHALRERLKLLHLVSELTAASWRLFPDLGSPSLGGRGGAGGGLDRVLGSDEARSVISPKVAALPMAQILQRTMVQGRNYGPVVTVKRLQTPSDNSAAAETTPIFFQLASQVARLDPSDLRLPARSSVCIPVSNEQKTREEHQGSRMTVIDGLRDSQGLPSDQH